MTEIDVIEQLENENEALRAENERLKAERDAANILADGADKAAVTLIAEVGRQKEATIEALKRLEDTRRRGRELKAEVERLESELERWKTAVPVEDGSGDPVDDPDRVAAFVSKQFDRLEKLEDRGWRCANCGSEHPYDHAGIHVQRENGMVSYCCSCEGAAKTVEELKAEVERLNELDKRRCEEIQRLRASEAQSLNDWQNIRAEVGRLRKALASILRRVLNEAEMPGGE